MATSAQRKPEFETFYTAFAEKVSEDSLRKLVNAFVRDRFLSEDEKLKMLQKHKEAKARSFIQTIRGKGPKAESKLKDLIKDKYPELAAKLHSEFETVYTAFAEKVSEKTFRKLINALVRDRFLSEDDKMNILQKHKEAKARSFIQTVRGKGPKAESKLKDLIKDKYPELAAKLHSDQMATPGQTKTPEDIEELQTAFVEKVSKDSLIKLIDALVSDGFLSKDEKKEILKQQKREDKAHALAVNVRGKGNEATLTMRRHIRDKYPELAGELCRAVGVSGPGLGVPMITATCVIL